MSSPSQEYLTVEDYTLKKTKRGRPPKKLAEETVFKTTTLSAKKTIPVTTQMRSFIVKLNITKDDLQFYKKALPYQNTQNAQNINDLRDMHNSNINFVNDFYNENIVPLFIGNVPVKTFSEELEESSSNDNSTKYKKNTTEFIAPMLNINNGEWPKTSPYACWNCDCYFTGSPVGIPISELNGIIKCDGNYCDFQCALRALTDSSYYDDKSTKISLLYMLYYSVFENYDLQPALPKQSMLKYGGKYSETEYHNYKDSDKIIEIYKLPMIPVLFKVVEVEKTQSISNIMKVKPVKGRSKEYVPIDDNALKRAREAVQALKKR